jgi:hypothetical protein
MISTHATVGTLRRTKATQNKNTTRTKKKEKYERKI